MNRLTSKQRKFVYLAGIVLLAVPIMLLGRPSAGQQSAGGKIAQLRQEHGLGEATLGDVDPSSATMNLVLLGLRGVATNLLWMDAQDASKKKNWGRVRANVDSIILLQPHYTKVWEFYGWDLAYNVSVEWDAVPDRYFWVKEGAKFTIAGTKRNQKSADLNYHTGTLFGKKIGRSDEWRQFRQYFRSDPDEQFEGGPDPDLNRDNEDNYLVAKTWYQAANDRERTNGQHVMATVLFRQYPAISMLDYPDALQREGKFGDVTRIAWSEGFDFLTDDFGKERFVTEYARNPGVFIEAEPEDVEAMALENESQPEFIRKDIVSLQQLCNYVSRRARSRIEATPEMVDAHRNIYEGQQKFKEGKVNRREIDGEDRPSEAQEQLELGMRQFDGLFKANPSLIRNQEAMEEAIMAVVYWHQIHVLNDLAPPEEFPLSYFYARNADLYRELRGQFRRENSF